MKAFTENLIKVQNELKVKKAHTNTFGGYHFRKAEDILEAVKPIAASYGLYVKLSDSIELIGNRYYVKAVATISDGENVESSEAYAREEETKKGMDGSQVTGASSSYARKYALNGLFGIDDTADADQTNDHGKAEKAQQQDKAPAAKPASTKTPQRLAPDSPNWASTIKALKEKGKTKEDWNSTIKANYLITDNDEKTLFSEVGW